MKNIKIQINKDLGIKKLTKGSIVSIECDNTGLPLNNFWFRRLKDSKLDNCISVIEDEPALKSIKNSKKED